MITVIADYAYFYSGSIDDNELMKLKYLPRIGETLILPSSLFKQEELRTRDQNSPNVYFKVMDILYYQEAGEVEVRLGDCDH